MNITCLTSRTSAPAVPSAPRQLPKDASVARVFPKEASPKQVPPWTLALWASNLSWLRGVSIMGVMGSVGSVG